jgi:hypothetical protein
MITPKEKALELVEKYKEHSWVSSVYGYEISSNIESAKQCALIACDEVIEYLTSSSDIMISVNALEYWQQVKNEIEKIK